MGQVTFNKSLPAGCGGGGRKNPEDPIQQGFTGKERTIQN